MAIAANVPMVTTTMPVEVRSARLLAPTLLGCVGPMFQRSSGPLIPWSGAPTWMPGREMRADDATWRADLRLLIVVVVQEALFRSAVNW